MSATGIGRGGARDEVRTASWTGASTGNDTASVVCGTLWSTYPSARKHSMEAHHVPLSLTSLLNPVRTLLLELGEDIGEAVVKLRLYEHTSR
jgi:hypothetical protein